MIPTNLALIIKTILNSYQNFRLILFTLELILETKDFVNEVSTSCLE